MSLSIDQFQIKKQVTYLQQTCREVGDLAEWTLSSCKHGNGIQQLRDENTETFWQSDGPIPHVITLNFQQKTRVNYVALYLDSKTDESYTPQTIIFKGGLVPQSLQEIKTINISNPLGWAVVPLSLNNSCKGICEGVYLYCLQISVVQMHHQGKDTHIRLVKVFSPQQTSQNDNYSFIAKQSTGLRQVI